MPKTERAGAIGQRIPDAVGTGRPALVRDLETSVLSLAIVRSIAEIARSIDKQTIAEFVENETVRLRLAQLGVDFGQGYGFDRPVPIEQYFLRPAAAPAPRASHPALPGP